MNLTVIQGIERTARSCANLLAGKCEDAAREDAISMFCRLGVELGIPAVVLRQLADDALDYDRAIELGHVTLDTGPLLACDADLRPLELCECHEVPERCLCGKAS